LAQFIDPLVFSDARAGPAVKQAVFLKHLGEERARFVPRGAALVGLGATQ